MKSRQKIKKILIFYVILFSFYNESEKVWAKTTQPLYEDPFDIGSGGAILTRATQEGMLISNPALLPYSNNLIRWAGIKTSALTARESINFVKSIVDLQKNAKKKIQEGQSPASFVDQLFQKPIHFGLSQTLSFITNNIGVAAFASTEPDIKAWQKGDPLMGSDKPSVILRNETYGGVIGSFATKTPLEYLSLGVSAKYLFVSDSEEFIDISNVEALMKAQESLGKGGLIKLNSGQGYDVGSLLFFQGDSLDLSFAATVTNVGGTKLKGNGEKKELKQNINAGVGIALHTGKDVLHLSADLRDITSEYHEKQFKRLFLGAKLLLRNYVGFGVGLYQGSPAYSAEVDLIIARLTGAIYTREYGNSPLADNRKLYTLSIAAGFSF